MEKYYEEFEAIEQEEQDAYEEEYLRNLRRRDGVTDAQEGFMVGYLADD